MKSVPEDNQHGRFLRDWMTERAVGPPSFKAIRRNNDAHQIEKVGEKLRGMMPWKLIAVAMVAVWKLAQGIASSLALVGSTRAHALVREGAGGTENLPIWAKGPRGGPTHRVDR